MQIKETNETSKMPFTKFVASYIIYMFVSGKQKNKAICFP